VREQHRRFDEREENYPADPDDQREKHEKSQEPHARSITSVGRFNTTDRYSPTTRRAALTGPSHLLKLQTRAW
jgi:hypothetical protein